MIFNAFLALLYGVLLLLTFPLRILPDVVIDPAIGDAIEAASVSLGTLATVIPVTTILAITALLIATELAILLWHGVNWLIRKIPAVN